MKLAKITLLAGILTLLRVASGFIVSKFVAVYAGPTGVAILGQLQSFVLGLNGLVANQVSQGVVRYTADNQEIDDYSKCVPWWHASTSLIMITLGITIPIICIFSGFISQWLFNNSEYYWVIIVAGAALPLNATSTILLATLNGLGENYKNIKINMLVVIASTTNIFLLLYFFGVEGGLFAVAINNAIAAFIVMSQVKNNPWFSLKSWFGKADPQKRKMMFGYLLMGVIGALTGPTALIMVRNIIITEVSLFDAGLWQSVLRVSEAYISVITIGVSMYYFPKAASIHRSSILKTETFNVLLFLVPVIILGASAVYFLRELIIEILFTEDFLGATPLFKPQVIGDVLRVLSFIPASILLAKGYFKTNAFMEIMINIVFVLCAYLLVPTHGVIGANYAYVIIYFIYFVFSYLFFFYHCNQLDSK